MTRVPTLVLPWLSTLICASAGPLVMAAPATSQPTTAPAEASSIARSLADLDNPDARVRETAQTRLMLLTRNDLPTLERLLKQGRPLAPSQGIALKQIVREIYLQGEDYEKVPTQGFLGIMMDDNTLGTRDLQQPNDSSPVPGVVVEDRIPGFCASRMLRDGDIILGTVQPDLVFYNTENLKTAIAGLDPGTEVRLQVIRQGQLIEVRVTLDTRPVEAESVQLAEVFRARRNKKFEEYWQSTFANLLRDSLG